MTYGTTSQVRTKVNRQTSSDRPAVCQRRQASTVGMRHRPTNKTNNSFPPATLEITESAELKVGRLPEPDDPGADMIRAPRGIRRTTIAAAVIRTCLTRTTPRGRKTIDVAWAS